MSITALAIYLVCIMTGGTCLFAEGAHVTEYAPLMGGINCQEPCELTASMTPVWYGTTAACGPGIPFGTRVFIDQVGWRTCWDRGGAIEDDEVDVAVQPGEYLQLGISGHHDVVWVMESP